MTNSSDQPTERPTSFVSQRGVALSVYILYLIGYKAPSSDEVLRSHYRFQIRTFWIGLLYLLVGWLLV